MSAPVFFVLKMLILAGEMLFAAFLFTAPIAFRKRGWIAPVASAPLLALILFLSYISLRNFPSLGSNTTRALFGFALGVLILYSVLLSKNSQPRPVLFFVNLGFAAAFFGDRLGALVETVLITTGAIADASPWLLLLNSLPSFFFIFSIFLLFKNGFPSLRVEIYGERLYAFLPFFTLLVEMLLEWLGGFIVDVRGVFELILIGCESLYALVMVLLIYSLIRQRQNDLNLYILKQLWEKDRKNYELQKETVAMINVKCHDMRHQLRALQAQNGSVDPRMIESVSKSINVYESVAKTGNEVLDVILSDYSLRCQKNEVQLTYMVDGSLLNILEEMDIYSLFGNLLENALEYEQKVEPKENRFVYLAVKLENGKILIHEENFFKGVLQLKDGLIETSKPDKNLHGFGMLSMHQLVDKYGGTMKVYSECDMFQVDIRLPQKEAPSA